jgi:hypothetical protein
MVNIWLAHWRAPRLLNYAPGANAIKPSTIEFRAESATKSEANRSRLLVLGRT